MNTNDMILIIVCASGKSTRFNANKLLHPLEDGKPLLLITLENILAGMTLAAQEGIPAKCMVIVPPASELSSELEQLSYFKEGAGETIELSVMDPPSQGLGETIAFAVKDSPNALGWMVCLGDMPRIEPEIILQMCQSVMSENSIVMPFVDGKRGHPVYFPQGYYYDLAELQGDQGAASVIKSASLDEHGKGIKKLHVTTRSILEDIDTQEDLARYLRN
ncbi:MAG: nucleotidyltransferase family protein [Oleibacter sp.]|nr:nucleotidyltransferase family protein [Thalassolituus sp.]